MSAEMSNYMKQILDLAWVNLDQYLRMLEVENAELKDELRSTEADLATLQAAADLAAATPPKRPYRPRKSKGVARKKTTRRKATRR